MRFAPSCRFQPGRIASGFALAAVAMAIPAAARAITFEQIAPQARTWHARDCVAAPSSAGGCGGLRDGATASVGPLPDARPALPPASFSDLASARLGVDLSGSACQIECLPSDAVALLDNRVVTAVPEPPVWMLLLVPLGLALMRWRR